MLPPNALKLLRRGTAFWVNREFTYGSKRSPIHAKAMCFHPQDGADWLRSNGHGVQKCGGVEIYCAEHYLKDRDLWGPGGVLIHELSHAFHNKHCPQGFDCQEIQDVRSLTKYRGPLV